MATGTAQPARLASLDQFRGYTVAGMFLVNFLGGYATIKQFAPLLCHHNTYYSYADTIMPQFFFAVGFSFRLTFLRRVEKDGQAAAIRHAFTRNIGLMLVGLAQYGIVRDEGLNWDQIAAAGAWGYITHHLSWSVIQTLIHIALASLWVLPAIGAAPVVRIVYLVASGLAHVLVSHFGYYNWNEHTGGTTDGGPLGFMTWAIPLLVGSLAYDTMSARGPRGSIRPFALWSVVLMALGYAFACLNAVHNRMLGNVAGGLRAWFVQPPFVAPTLPVDMWTMSQHAGAASYMTFSAGFSLIVLVFFIWLSDIQGVHVGMFRTLGVNALAAYIIHDMTGGAIGPLVPEDAPLYMALLNFLLFFWLTWLFLRHLEKHKLYLRL
jgi:predicted acyltransferase